MHTRAFGPASHLRPVRVEGLRRRSAFLQTTPILACIAQETCSLFLSLQNLFEETSWASTFSAGCSVSRQSFSSASTWRPTSCDEDKHLTSPGARDWLGQHRLHGLSSNVSDAQRLQGPSRPGPGCDHVVARDIGHVDQKPRDGQGPDPQSRGFWPAAASRRSCDTVRRRHHGAHEWRAGDDNAGLPPPPRIGQAADPGSRAQRHPAARRRSTAAF